MPLVCTAAGVVAAAAPFDSLSDRELQVAITYLLAVSSGFSASTPQQILNSAAAFEKCSDRELQMMQVYLLCIAAGGS